MNDTEQQLEAARAFLMERDNGNPAKVRQMIEVVGKAARAMVTLIGMIEDEDDPEVVEILVDSMQEVDASLIASFGGKPRNVRDLIRAGVGDNATIRDKCIAMGIV